MQNFKCKIFESDITYGPQQFDLDDTHAFLHAGKLQEKGYYKVSNAYCRVARIDRDDWLLVLAKSMNCSVADFYNVDGTGVSNRWRDHYVRCFSEDVLTVSPSIIRRMSTWS
jgi:hypothetical protein